MNICYSSIVNTDTVEINLIPQKKGTTENKYNKDLATIRDHAAVVTNLGIEGECERRSEEGRGYDTTTKTNDLSN